MGSALNQFIVALIRECLNVVTVPTFKMHNVGTVSLFKRHNIGIGTVLMFKMHNVGTHPIVI